MLPCLPATRLLREKSSPSRMARPLLASSQTPLLCAKINCLVLACNFELERLFDVAGPFAVTAGIPLKAVELLHFQSLQSGGTRCQITARLVYVIQASIKWL